MVAMLRLVSVIVLEKHRREGLGVLSIQRISVVGRANIEAVDSGNAGGRAVRLCRRRGRDVDAGLNFSVGSVAANTSTNPSGG
jgi:hypothetical protein